MLSQRNRVDCINSTLYPHPERRNFKATKLDRRNMGRPLQASINHRSRPGEVLGYLIGWIFSRNPHQKIQTRATKGLQQESQTARLKIGKEGLGEERPTQRQQGEGATQPPLLSLLEGHNQQSHPIENRMKRFQVVSKAAFQA